jgi:hypothetical protein
MRSVVDHEADIAELPRAVDLPPPLSNADAVASWNATVPPSTTSGPSLEVVPHVVLLVDRQRRAARSAVEVVDVL